MLVKQVSGFEDAWIAVWIEAVLGERAQVDEEEEGADGNEGEQVKPDDRTRRIEAWTIRSIHRQ